MTASSGSAAFRTLLYRTSYIIAELSEIQPQTIAREMIDTTSHDSADGYSEFIPGLKDGGTVKITGNFIIGDTYGQIALITDMESGTSRAYILAFPNALNADWEFNAYVTSIVTTTPLKDAIKFEAELRIVGKPTLYTTGSTGTTTPFFALKDNDTNAITPSPAAAGAVYDYTATALTGATSVIVTPTAAAGTIYVDGETVTSGADSSGSTLGAAGSTLLIRITVKESVKAPKVYRINVTRAPAA